MKCQWELEEERIGKVVKIFNEFLKFVDRLCNVGLLFEGNLWFLNNCNCRFWQKEEFVR